jgi:SAM-dependent methyltransferase
MLRAYGEMLFSHAPPDVADHPQMSFARRWLPERRDAAILDAGCGNGAYALALARAGYTRVTAVDLHERVETGGLFEYRRASIDATGLPPACFDFVYSFSVIYHLPDLETALRELHRVMKPGAVLVFSAHTRYSLFTLDRVLRRRLGGAVHLRGVRFHSAGDYRRTLGRVGFEVLDVDGFGLNYFAGGRLAAALRRLRRPRGPAAAGPPLPDPRWLRRLRALAGYHMLIAARKPAGAATSSP